MKTLVLALAVLLLPLVGSYAGPNHPVVLGVQGNVDGVATEGDPCTAIVLPVLCEELVPTATADGNGMEWFLIVAVRDFHELAFNSITFGIGDYDPVAIHIAQYGPCFSEFSPQEIPSDGWPIGTPPGESSGTSITWAPECLTGCIVPVYYFGIYAYGPASIVLGDYYPGQTGLVASCHDLPAEDPIVVYGEIGCGGDYVDPLWCYPYPVMQTTWGQIKAVYR